METFDRASVFSAEHLMQQEFEPTQWLVDNLVPEGLMVLSGAPKIGKSFLSLELAVAVATEGSFLGHPTSKKRGVLVLALEDGPARLFNRMKTAEFPAPENLYFSTEAADVEAPEKLERYLLQHPFVDLVIIDTLGFYLPPSSSRGQNAYDNDVARMRAIKKIVQATSSSIILIHHDKQGEEGDWANKINGTSGIIGTADTLGRLSVAKRGAREASFQITGRDIEDIELALKLDDATMRWSVDKKRDLETLTELQMEVLNLIPFSPEQISNQEIRKIINRKSPQISEILSKLKKRGHIEGRGYGCYGRVST